MSLSRYIKNLITVARERLKFVTAQQGATPTTNAERKVSNGATGVPVNNHHPFCWIDPEGPGPALIGMQNRRFWV